DDYPAPVDPPYCTVLGPLVHAGIPPLLEVRAVAMTTYDRRTIHIGIRTEKGVFLTKGPAVVTPLRDPGAGGGSDRIVKAAEIVATPRGPALVTVIDRHDW